MAPAGGDEDSRANTQGLLLLDLDHFKTVNDRHGHAGGDAVLIAIAGRLRETLREEDMVVRWGGEEFLVYAPAVSPGRLDDIALRLPTLNEVFLALTGQEIEEEPAEAAKKGKKR